jgi:hypothetical protein
MYIVMFICICINTYIHMYMNIHIYVTVQNIRVYTHMVQQTNGC